MYCTGWNKPVLLIALLAPSVLVLAENPAPPQTSFVVNDEYQVGKVRQWLFGRDYRQVWATPVELPALDLSKTAGGLSPIKEVGQLQTVGLAMAGADGRAYTFRSVRKDPTRALPVEYQGTAVAEIVRDQVSADLPAASLLVAPINKAAGLLHTPATLVVMPDDPALGEFRDQFAGVVGTFQEFPTKRTFQAEAIIDGGEIFARLEQDIYERVDSRQYLTARLVDLLIGDWDRHISQWRWVKLPGKPAWLPLAEDRDHAFSSYDGVVMSMWRDREPRFLNFGPEFEPLEGTLWRGRELDRRLLGELSAEDFGAVARQLQGALDDAVLAEAVGRMPAEWRALKGDFLYDSLRRRRDALVDYAMDYYRFLAAEADVFGSDLPALYQLNTAAAGGVELAIYALGGGPGESCASTLANSEPFFSREFLADETRQVRGYMGGGADKLVLAPELSSSIDVYLVSKPGTVDLCSAGEEADHEMLVPDGLGKGLSLASETWLAPAQHGDNLNWQTTNTEGSALAAKRDWGSTSYGVPWLAYNNDLGIFIGYGRAWESFGFRQRPYGQRHMIRGGYAFGRDRPKVDYQWDYRFVNRPLKFTRDATYSGVDSLYYFGFGNETENEFGGSFYDTDSTTVRTDARLTRFSSFGNWSAGLVARYTNTKNEGLVGIDQPIGFGTVRQAGLLIAYQWANREGEGQRAGTDDSWRHLASEEQPGYGVRAEVEHYPSVWDVEQAYGLFKIQGRADYRLWRDFDRLSLRLGAQQNWGEYTYYDAAVVGSSQVRGLSSDRFSGDASIYGNLAFKFDLGGLRLIIPGRWGTQLRGDVGRVYYSDESSSVWHPSAGLGFWWKPVTGATSLNLLVARSREDTRVYLMLGARF